VHDPPPGLAVPHQPGTDLPGGADLQQRPLPTPDDARLLARPSAVVAACWLVWPLTTATGPRSGSARSACTTNQRDRPRERTTTGAPPPGTGTRNANAAGASPAASVIAATGSAMRAGAGEAVTEGTGLVALPSAR